MKTGRLGTHEAVEDGHYAGVIKRALTYLHSQVAKDAAMLAAHQQIADISLALQEKGLECDPSIPQVRRILDRVHRLEQQTRHRMTEQAWRYHALSTHGIAKRLQPLAQAVESGDPLPESAAQDQLLVSLITGDGTGTQLQEQSTETECEELEASFESQDVNLCEDEDGNAECGCPFCTRMFEPIEAADLEPLQQWLVDHYHIMH